MGEYRDGFRAGFRAGVRAKADQVSRGLEGLRQLTSPELDRALAEALECELLRQRRNPEFDSIAAIMDREG